MAVMRTRKVVPSLPMDAKSWRRAEREATVRGLRALDEPQAMGREAGITEDAVRKEIEAFRAGR